VHRWRFFLCGCAAVAFWQSARSHPIEKKEDFLAFQGVKAVSVVISPKQNWVAAGGYKAGTVKAIGSIKVWDFKTRKEVFTYEDPNGSIQCLAFSPDGKYLASGGLRANTTVKLWDLEAGKPYKTFRHPGEVQTLAFSPDGQFLATGCYDESGEQRNFIYLWNLKTGAKEALRPKEKLLEYLQFSPKGNVLGSASKKSISLWDVEARKETSTFAAHEKRITCLAFSPDQRFLASTSMDGTIRAWQLGMQPRQLWSLEAHNAGTWGVVFSLDGKWLISGGYDRPKDKEFGGKGMLKIWKLKDKKLFAAFDAHDSPTLSVALSKDGHYIGSGSQDGTVKVWTAPKELSQKERRGDKKVETKRCQDPFPSE
jgi:WD40 repeat protein